VWGGLSAGSLLPAGFSVLRTSRPEGGCRLIARPTYSELVFNPDSLLCANPRSELAQAVQQLRPRFVA